MDTIRQQFVADLAAADGNAKAVEDLRVKYFGRKGTITQLAKNTDFSKFSSEERKSFGIRLNELKTFAEEAIRSAQESAKAASAAKPKAKIDLTLPGADHRLGSMHPISLVQIELEEIFQGMGFRVLTGYEIETEFNNFTGLNIPEDHPAREMQDTYWLKNGMLLRTHTSPNQVRAMRKFGAPVRAIFPGRCFRNEATDACHETTFYQCEGLMVDRNISVANLIAVMRELLCEVFRREVTVRLRPGFFPFVEPGFELDVQCLICGGKGCPTCKQSGWLELMPCGLIHPRVLEMSGIDSKEFSGFAFGVGLTRLAMMKYGIPDIRLLLGGDIRFFEQFAATV
ncbi:MAG: phenylalanine--tRNA ligase subunit alpha [Thermoguttaceae bacterium]|nr:phenylalanine--tRNA ligase subunit alpha [Thermoguttaceae bacterium]